MSHFSWVLSEGVDPTRTSLPDAFRSLLAGSTHSAAIISAEVCREQGLIQQDQAKPPTMPDDSFSRLSGWHALSSQAQANLVSLIQNPSAFSHLLALQQAMFSSPPNPSDDLHPYTEAVTARSSMTGMFSRSHQGPQLTNSQDTPYLARPTASFPNASGLNIQLPSPPQLDRSLLRAPSWALPSGCNGPATLSAAETSATQQAASGFNQPPQPVADFSSDLFRSTSMGSRYLSTPLPAELSLRASSMPGSFQDIAARLHLNRAGINTATASMIPVLSQDWLVIPFGTAQQLLPVYAGDMLAEDGGDAVMLIDETGRNWPMKCAYCRCALHNRKLLEAQDLQESPSASIVI